MNFKLLEQQSFIILDDFLPADLLEEILRDFNTRIEQDQLSKAAIGKGSDKQLQLAIRGDFIYWLNNLSPEIPRSWKFIQEQLDEICNYFRIPSLTPELHYALYPPQSKYAKHLDVFKKDSDRVLTFILYLNESWEATDGGQLKMYFNDSSEQIIAPLLNRCIIFFSSEIPHEVLLTQKERKSLTGWFKRTRII